jgi:hypothetical protein
MRTRILLVAAPAAAALALATPAVAYRASRAAFHSRVFAGWSATTTPSAFKLTTTVVLPKLKCHRAEQAIIAQVGSATSSPKGDHAGVLIACKQSRAHYFPTFTIEGTTKSFPKLKAKAGDIVVLAVSLSRTTSGKLLVRDKTTRRVTKSLSAPAASKLKYARVGDEALIKSAKVVPVPNFGRITFSRTDYQGAPLQAYGALFNYDRYKHSTRQISTSGFTGAGDTFKTVFHHS